MEDETQLSVVYESKRETWAFASDEATGIRLYEDVGLRIIQETNGSGDRK